jgi:hypothetical protein
MSKEYSAGTRVDHTRYGEGMISKVNLTSYEIFFSKVGKMDISKNSPDLDFKEAKATEEPDGQVTFTDFEKILRELLEKHNAFQEIVPLGDKWINGKIIIQPSNPTLQSKEIPIDVFFHKIVMLRDRLRVLEQNINSHPKLTDEEKVDFQQYITRIYGSLTTFNLLFREKDQYFVGAKSG